MPLMVDGSGSYSAPSERIDPTAAFGEVVSVQATRWINGGFHVRFRIEGLGGSTAQ
jgi:hypothetical protein